MDWDRDRTERSEGERAWIEREAAVIQQADREREREREREKAEQKRRESK
jgi:hypothetical protein